MDPERSAISVLIMANNNEKNEITAEELIGKLGLDSESVKDETPFADKLSSLDLSGAVSEESESDLDISELLHKYLPEYEEMTEDKPEDSIKENGLSDFIEDNGIVEADDIGKVLSTEKIIDGFDDEPEQMTMPYTAGVFSEYDITEEPVKNEENQEADEESVKTRRFLDNLINKKAAEIEDEYEDNEVSPSNDEAMVLDDAEELSTDADIENELRLSDGLFTKADDSQNVELMSDTEENPDGENEIDPTDINLMIAFDMDSDDEEKSARAKELGDKFETKQNARQSKKFVLDRPEYVDKSQTSDLKDEFKKKKTSVMIRTVICAVFAVVLFVFENIATITQLFGGNAQQFSGAVDPALYPVVYIMVGLQIALFACICALPEIIAGVKSLFRGMPNPATLTALLAVADIIYSIVLCNLIKSPNEPVLFGLMVALSALMTLIAEGLNNKREMMNFRVISGKKPKHVVRHMLDEESENETGAFADDDQVCDVMKIQKTDFISNFFTRLRTPDQGTGTTVTFIMGVIVAAGILFGIFASMRWGGDGAMAWRVVFSTIFMLAPLSVYFAFSYPFYRANRAAGEYDSAIIGEVSLEEYSNASIISFDDKNVFPSYAVKVQNIRIYNNARIDRVLYYASSVFATAGGPLQDVFEIATKDMGTSENVQIFDTEAGFLATQVDGVNIIFGNYDALTSRGLEIPENAADDDVDLSDELSIMYMFRESKLVAKMYIKYDMDEDIDVILKQFAGDGLYVCVRTFDPNIDETMIAHKLGVKRVPLKVVRYSNSEEMSKYEEKVDSGLVTSSSPKSLLQVISYCEKVLHARKTNTALGVLSLVIGVALLLLLLLAGSISVLTSFLLALYQLVWIIPIIISSKMYIR